jgi:hypothetical protein
MRIVLIITALEGLGLAIWLMIRRNQKKQLSTALAAPGARMPAEVNELVRQPLDPQRWVFVNEWQSEGQSDDRSPMLDIVAENRGSPSAMRASARRSHQLNFKKWSTERHD